MTKVSAGSNHRVIVSMLQLHYVQLPFPSLSSPFQENGNSKHLLSADSMPGAVLNA